MAEARLRPLIEVLAEVPDFRKSQGRRYQLGPILALVCAAVLCGYTSYGAIAEWGQNYGAELAKALGFKDGKTPSVGTLYTVLTSLDKQALEEKLAAWAEVAFAQMGKPGSLLAIAIDGKQLRGSQKQGACEAHLLSALGQQLGVTLFQKAVSDKTNEISAIQEVLAALVLQGRVVTVDALLTQKEVAATIRAKGGTTSW